MDTLDITIATQDSGTIDIICPNLAYVVDYECSAFALDGGQPVDISQAIEFGEQIVGSKLSFEVSESFKLNCTIVCEDRFNNLFNQ